MPEAAEPVVTSASPLPRLRALHVRRSDARLREIEASVRLQSVRVRLDAATERATHGAPAAERERVQRLLAERAALESARFRHRQDRLALDREIRHTAALVRPASVRAARERATTAGERDE